MQPRIFEFFIERLCSGLWSGCFSIFPPTPIPYVSSFHCFISLTGAWNGGSWQGCGDLPAMGAVFYLGAGWPQWKPLGIYPRHPASTYARQLVKYYASQTWLMVFSLLASGIMTPWFFAPWKKKIQWNLNLTNTHLTNSSVSHPIFYHVPRPFVVQWFWQVCCSNSLPDFWKKAHLRLCHRECQ